MARRPPRAGPVLAVSTYPHQGVDRSRAGDRARRPAQEKPIIRMSGRLARLAKALAWIYLVALLGVLALFWFVGERWWPVVVLLYLPRLTFALPLVVTVPALLAIRARRLLGTQAL